MNKRPILIPRKAQKPKPQNRPRSSRHILDHTQLHEGGSPGASPEQFLQLHSRAFWSATGEKFNSMAESLLLDVDI